MKNRSDTGKVHYDQATALNYVDRVLSFRYRLGLVKLLIKLPLDIKAALKSEDWDAAIVVAKRAIDDYFTAAMKCGDFRYDHILIRAIEVARLAVCEHLYNAFTVEQARRGNEVWATPKQMQDVGPSPEQDFRRFS